MRRALGMLFVLLFSSLAAGTAAAQPGNAIVLTVEPSQVAVGETFRVQMRVGASGGQLQQPSLPILGDFDIVGRSSSFGFSNGSASSTTTLLVRARREGRFTIGPGTAFLHGRSVQSNTATITVVGAGASNALPSAPNPNGGVQLTPIPPQGMQDPNAPSGVPLTPSNPQSADAVQAGRYDPVGFIVTEASGRAPFVGEEVHVTIWLYVSRDLTSQPMFTREPTTDGFWVQDLRRPNERVEAERVVVQGNYFLRYPLRKIAAYPLREGKLTIGAPEIRVDTGTVFDFFSQGGDRQLVRNGEPLELEVRPLPASGRPANASSVNVGRLTVQATLDRNQVATGDAATLTATVRGDGTLRDVVLEIPQMNGLRVLPPEVSEQLDIRNQSIEGTKTFRWIMIPERAGDHAIAPFVLDYFDPATEQYGRAETQRLVLRAMGGPSNASAQAPVDDESANGSSEDSDWTRSLPPLRTHSAFERRPSSVLRSPAFWAVSAAIPAIFGCILLISWFRNRARKGGTLAADRQYRKTLQEAERAATQGDASQVYPAIFNALKVALEAHLDAQIGSMTYPRLREKMLERDFDAELAGRIINELEGAEFARFAASAGEARELREAVLRAKTLIERLERQGGKTG